MSAVEALWFIGQLGAAWLFGFGVGATWIKFRNAVYKAASFEN